MSRNILRKIGFTTKGTKKHEEKRRKNYKPQRTQRSQRVFSSKKGGGELVVYCVLCIVHG